MPFILDSPAPPPFATNDSNHFLRTQHHTADVIVVGAGILGTTIAITLARQSRSVILLEKSLKEPDRIVGELLQPGGVQALEKLGLRQCLDSIDACVVQGYEVIYYGEGVHIPYPENSISQPQQPGLRNGKPSTVRPEGRSFHHGRFVRRLREAAFLERNILLVESTVTSLITSTYTPNILGVTATTKGAPDFYFAPQTIIADGYASKFRKPYHPHEPTSSSKFYGLELIDADLPRPSHGHVILSQNAPILLYQIGTHETRALIDVPANLPSASHANGGVKAHLRTQILPSLPPCVQPSFAAALDRGRLRSMPNSFLPPSTNLTPGLVLLGDAMNMRHPLTGGGMTVALNDVLLLRDLLSPQAVPDLADTQLVLKQLRTFHWHRKSLSAVINILAQALYALFAADDRDGRMRALQLGCFRYFQRGGECVDGPVGLLAGIIRRPLVLVYHFFSVALLAMGLVLGRNGILGVMECVGVLWKACMVLGPVLGSELRG